MTELADLSVRELLDLYRTGEASPVEAVMSCLGRIERLDPVVDAVLTLTDERALEQAARSEERYRRGSPRPLDGVPFGLKDIIDVAGVRGTGGSRLYEDRVPTESAVVAKRLDAAGGALVGKLQTFELAAGVSATTSNPWDLARTAAGSSSGSAAALAARELPLTIGTDTGGSVAIPASFCGVVGLKPTFGRVPRAGVMPISWTLDHVGPMTRTAYDAALALSVIAGHDPHDPTSAVAPVDDYTTGIGEGVTDLRIGVATDWFFDIIEPAVERATRQALDALVDAGAMLVEVAFPSTRKVDLHAQEITIIGAELASLHEITFERLAEYGEEFQRLLARTQFIHAVDYLKALRSRALVQDDFEAAFERCDVMVVPGAVTIAPRHDRLVADVGDSPKPWAEVVSRTTAIFNITGLPSLSIPAGFGDSGMPVGIQIAARPYAEALLFRVAHAFQELTQHHLAVPAIVASDAAASHPTWDGETTQLDRSKPVVTLARDHSW